MSNKVTNEPKYITNKDVNIFQNQKISISKVEKTPVTTGKKTDSTSKDTALLRQRASDPVSTANKISLQSNPQKRENLLSDMSKIIFGNVMSKDQVEALAQETEIARKKYHELHIQTNTLYEELQEIRKELGQAEDKTIKEKISKKISIARETYLKAYDKSHAAYTDYDARYNELRSLREQANSNTSDLSISMALAPKILEAVESGNFTSDFIDSLCDKFLLIRPTPSYLLNIHKQFRQMSSDPAVLKAFNDNVKDYLQQSNAAKNENAEKQFIKNANLFIYNTIAFPHQRDGEGSCYATSMAIKVYQDKKIDYMTILRGIIDKNIVDFSCLGSKVAPIKVNNFGLDCNEQDIIYQKLISAIAELCPSINKIHTKIFDQQIKKICESLEKTTAEIISDGLLSHGLVWSHRRIPAVCAFSDILKTRASIIAHIKDRIKEIIADHGLDRIEEHAITEIAEKIFANVRTSGGFAHEVAANLSDGAGGQKIEIDYGAHPIVDSIFESTQIQRILDGLEYGNFDGDRSRRLRPGQTIVTTYFKSGGGGHAFTLLAGHYDINSMAVGDKVRIGHMNYPDNACDDSYIYLVKVADNQFQLMHKGRPINVAIKRMQLFTNLATEYEPVPKPAAPKPITREIKINPAPTLEDPTVINKIKIQKPKRERPNGANSTNPKVPAIVEPAKKTPNPDKPSIDRPLPKKSTDKPTISLSTKKSITFSRTSNVKPVANSPVSVKKINAKTEINTPIVSRPTQNKLVVVKKLNDPAASRPVQNEPKGNNNRMSLSKMNGNHRHTNIPNGQKNNITPRSQRNEPTNTRMSLSRMNGNHRNLDIPSSSRANTPASRPQRNEPAAIDNRISLSKMNNNYKRVSTKGGFAHEIPNTSVNNGVPSKNSGNNQPPRPRNNQPRPGNIRRNH